MKRLRVLNVRLAYRPLLLSFKEIMETLRCGFPAAADYFAENIVMGIQNNLILAGFPGDALILLIPIVLLAATVTGKRKDRLLLLPEEFYSDKLLSEFEISGDRIDMTAELEEFYAPLETALSDSDRVNSVMHCVEKIVSDMRCDSKDIHFKLLDEGVSYDERGAV